MLIVVVEKYALITSILSGCCEVGTGNARPSPARKRERCGVNVVKKKVGSGEEGCGEEGWGEEGREEEGCTCS